MIDVKVSKQDTIIKEVTMSGHADFAEHGKDIVCAAASSVAIVSVNAILTLNEEALQADEKDGYLKIDVLSIDNTTQKLLQNLIDSLLQIQEDYPEHIKIRIQEVYLC